MALWPEGDSPSETGLYEEIIGFASLCREDLIVVTDVISSVIRSGSLSELLGILYTSMSGPFKMYGCGFYRSLPSDSSFRLLSVAGDCRLFLLEDIALDSELARHISEGSTIDTVNTPPEQQSLFDDLPQSFYWPVKVDGELVGALAAVHDPKSTGAVGLVFGQVASVIELLCKANRLVDELSSVEPLGEEESVSAIEGVPRKLTAREKEILILLARGLSNKEIAERLHISSATCKNHVQNVLGKLEVHNRAAAAVVALSEGYYSP